MYKTNTLTGIFVPFLALLATYSARLGDTDAVYTDGFRVSHSHHTAKNVVSSATSKSDLLSCIFLIALALVVYVSRNVANFNDLPFSSLIRKKVIRLIIQFMNKMIKENATCKKISEHVVEVKGLDQNLSGFKILTENDILIGDYSAYTTLYRTVDDGFQYSNDGSVYEEPIPEPIPEPTLDDVKAAKVSEMNTIQQQIIANGCEVQLSDGTSERFTLTQNDQLSLNSLSVKVLEGMTFVPWHPANEDVPCRFYTEADMKTITDTCLNFVSWHVTWFRDLRRYIRSLTTKEEVEAITYDSYIPTEYQSEVLIAMMSQKSSQGV